VQPASESTEKSTEKSPEGVGILQIPCCFPCSQGISKITSGRVQDSNFGNAALGKLPGGNRAAVLDFAGDTQ
jgi:hypothetical protein